MTDIALKIPGCGPQAKDRKTVSPIELLHAARRRNRGLWQVPQPMRRRLHHHAGMKARQKRGLD
jgi:hypothetical protein